MAMPKKVPMSIYDMCIQITGDFEGSGYGKVTGNFDGQGLSLGFLQWNFGQGTFQDYILNNVDVMAYNYFPLPIHHLQKLSNEQAVNWIKDVMLEGNEVKANWKLAWERFLLEPSVINVQKRAIDKYFHQAKTICGQLDFPHDNKRAMAFSFDLAVQNWSLDVNLEHVSTDHAYNILSLYGPDNARLWLLENLTTEKAKLVIAAHFKALKVNPKWRKDVFTRKCTIAMGIGIVHGKTYKLNKLFG